MRFRRINGAISLEVHRYAPEMNKLCILGKSFSVGAVTSFKGAYEQLGWTPSKLRIIGRIETIYPEEWKHLNRTWVGYVDKRSTALTLKRQVLSRESGVDRRLFDGRQLPVPRVTLKTWIVGG